MISTRRRVDFDDANLRRSEASKPFSARCINELRRRLLQRVRGSPRNGLLMRPVKSRFNCFVLHKQVDVATQVILHIRSAHTQTLRDCLKTLK
jgi:hypothetical protein